jgi:unsaturated chondroitin disaccharide hydrolase
MDYLKRSGHLTPSRIGLLALACISSSSFATDTPLATGLLGAAEHHWLDPIEWHELRWAYHASLGWLYLPDEELPEAEGGESWLYSPSLGWLLSGAELFPFIYRAESESWIWSHGRADRESSWCYDFTVRGHWQIDEAPPALLVRAHGALWQADGALRERVAEVGRYDRYPIQTTGPAWRMVEASDWTSGFWPGMLWLMYEFSGDAYWAIQGQRWLTALEGQKSNTSTHDLGFMLYTSYGRAFRMTERADYAAVLMAAADSLMKRYSAAVGAMRSWSWGDWAKDNRFTVIVDNLMNLDLLAWASARSGKPEYLAAAITHGKTTARDFFRTDGGTRHVVVYHQRTGAILERTTHQGYSADSTWARGQAWAMYGFTSLFRDSNDPAFLGHARRAADYFLQRLPDDIVPFWDFQAPGIPQEPRDSSAAAIAASALLEMAALDPEQSQLWQNAAESLIASLLRPPYWRAIPSSNALLAAGTYNAPQGNSNTAVIWGDYYLLEAMVRYIGQQANRICYVYP